MYRKEGAIGASLVRISPEGILETMDFEFSAEITAGDHLNEFVKLPDGSYFLGGSRVYLSDKNEDIILVKTTATGKEISVNRLDIQMGDWVRHMHATADGLLLLGMSGRSSLNDLNKGDLLVVKTDLDGSEMWRRAFASPVADIGYFISSLNENIYVAARMGVTGNSLTTPVVMQLDNLGHLPDDFPFSLAENSEIKTLNTGINDNLQVLSDAIAGSDNNIILGINRLDHEYDNWLPYVVASDTSGDIDWELNLPPHYGEIKVLSRIRPNDNLVITEIRDIFTNLYYVTQFNDEGKIGWTYETGASHMRTAIRTRDGGYLLVGDVDISFVNYDVQITKLDEKGVQLWQKTIGVHGKWEMPRCVAETPEGDLIIAGTSLKEFDEVSVLYALRITQTGQVQWQRELGLGIVEENAFTIVHTTDGNYMVGGFYHTQPLDNRNVMLAKFDGSGQLLSKKTFNLHHHDAIQSMIPKANGGYIAVGNNSGYQWGTWQQRGFVLQVSEDGIATNSTFYGPASQHLSFQKLLVTTSNDTLLLGNYQPFYGYSRPFYLKVQTNRSEPLPLYPKDPYIFPNPSLGSSRLRWISPDEGLLKIQVYNSNGQLCFSTVDHKLAGLYQYELPQLKAVAGIYFVRLEIGKFVRTLKWIKQ
jgi:hypothetical protein